MGEIEREKLNFAAWLKRIAAKKALWESRIEDMEKAQKPRRRRKAK